MKKNAEMGNSKLIILLSSLFLIISFNACKVGHRYKSLELANMPASFDNGGDSIKTAADIGWSTLYQDTILQSLIDKSLVYNKDILIATARIKEMIAAKRIKFASLLPETSVELGGQREYLNYNGAGKAYDPELRANVGIGWEIDIWGNLRWQNDAATAQYIQSVEYQKALYLTIIAQVAQTYFELRALDRQLAIIKETLEIRKKGVDFAKLRYEGGLTSEIPYRQSLVELARTETLVPEIENQIELKENDLAILIGDYPSSEILRGYNIYETAAFVELPVDVPSALLRRRPDVRMAEQSLIEKNALVAVALTDMFPKINLTGITGWENETITNFLSSPTWFVSSFLTGPVFSFGKNKAQHNVAKAAYEAEVYRYEKVVLNVFREVNNAISSLQKAQDMRESQRKRYESSQTYYQLAQLQYVNGVVNYIDVLDSQRQLFDAEIAFNNAILNELIATVNMYKALGGGVVR